jgi:ESCRT-I complex subunit VPS37
VRLTDGTLTSLRISLLPSFPTDRPALSITSPVRHPWVDSIGRLSFPLLDRWGIPTVRLAAVVADAFKGLGGTPAPLPSRAQAPAGGTSAQSGQLYGQPLPPPPLLQQQQPGSHPLPMQQHSSGALSGAGSGPASSAVQQPPAIPSSFPEVDSMSEEQLSLALVNQHTYKQLVDQIAQRLKLYEVRTCLLRDRCLCLPCVHVLVCVACWRRCCRSATAAVIACWKASS